VYKLKYIILVLLLIPIVYADSAVQTDWSGGSGVWGPVIELGDEFLIDTDVDFLSTSGSLILGSETLAHSVDTTFNGATMVYSEDIDGDGFMDIIAAAAYHDITWWRNTDGSGTSLTEFTFTGSIGHRNIHFGDIDNDGDMDLVSCHWSGQSVNWWENVDGSGTSWTRHYIDSSYNSAQYAYSEDIDGDGDMDVLASSFFTDTFTWWENTDGLGTTWIEHTIDTNADGARMIRCADIDGDGDVDILGAMAAARDIVWYENVDGSGTVFSKHWVDPNVNMASYVHSEDIDGDGDVDVLGCGYEICWWENGNGSGTQWFEHDIADGMMCLYSDDIDGDGDMDVLGAGGASIIWWENVTGAGLQWTGHIVYWTAESFWIYSEDINGDGNPDILFSDYLADKIVWLDLNAYVNGILESSCLYLQNDPGWGSIDWTTEEPQGTSVAFQVRSCDSPDSTVMGAWSDTLFSPGTLAGILNEGDSFFQYRALLQTSDASVTPVLHDVTVSWDPMGIEGSEDPAVIALLPFSPNPASAPAVRFSLPEPASVEISVFEVSGRLVDEIHGDEYDSGFHDVLLEELSPGIYFCRMISGDFTATQRFVVIE